MTTPEEARLKLKDTKFLILQLDYQYLMASEKCDVETVALCDELKFRVIIADEMYKTLEGTVSLIDAIRKSHPEYDLDNVTYEICKLLAKAKGG